jgi:phage gp37-like protein
LIGHFELAEETEVLVAQREAAVQASARAGLDRTKLTGATTGTALVHYLQNNQNAEGRE